MLLKSKHKVVSKSYLFKVILERYQVSAYEFENTAVYFIREYETKTVSASDENPKEFLFSKLTFFCDDEFRRQVFEDTIT